MARRKSKKKSYGKSSFPDPISGFIDLAGAAAMGAIARHKLLSDYKRGQGKESAKAATMVFGAGSLRQGSAGSVNFGGLLGIKSALKEIERMEQVKHGYNPSLEPAPDFSDVKIDVKPPRPVRKYAWRQYCEDGSCFGVSPMDYETADEYAEALSVAKAEADRVQASPMGFQTPEAAFEHSCAAVEPEKTHTEKKYVWRKHCEDGSKYGISPEDYETADEYAEALEEAKHKNL